MTDEGMTPDASPSPDNAAAGSAPAGTPGPESSAPAAAQPGPVGGAPQYAQAPPAYVAPAYYGYAAPPLAGAQAPRRSRWWIWVALIAILMLCAIGSCAPIWLLAGDGGASSSFAGITRGAVAVIQIDGTIQGSGSADAVTPAGMYDQLQQAEKDPRVKAIVLRVNSGGGTVAASEEIASYVKNARKPVVVSVSDICASGAYMISSQADKIYAVEGSDVGSIGVIMQIPNVQGLLDKLGISMTTITSGEYKDAGSPFRKLTPEEQARLKGQVDEVYNQFIDIVAEGRNMPRTEVRKLATGWVWTGVEAKKLGLVDELGTYPDAIAAAAKLGGIDGEPEIITYDEPFRDLLSGLGGVATHFAPYGAATDPRQVVPK